MRSVVVKRKDKEVTNPIMLHSFFVARESIAMSIDNWLSQNLRHILRSQVKVPTAYSCDG